MSNNPSEQVTDQPKSGDGPADRPNGSIDDDSVHPLNGPPDPTTGNVDPVVPTPSTGIQFGESKRSQRVP